MPFELPIPFLFEIVILTYTKENNTNPAESQ